MSDKIDLSKMVHSMNVEDIIKIYPVCMDFFANHNLDDAAFDMTAADIFESADDDCLAEFGFSKHNAVDRLISFLEVMTADAGYFEDIGFITLVGGNNKSGRAEGFSLTVRKGEIVSIVGPTGSGKSRLLADIECIAQGDTPTGRRILINGKEAGEEDRLAMEGRIIAQLSQNMNFVMDVSVEEFLNMHARSRMLGDIGQAVSKCFDCANGLTGEKFKMSTKITQLSGGQSRALMIADTAFISVSPIILIDEIENAGIDRKAAINLLSQNGKIVFVSTHDPILALYADKRIVIKDGGIFKVIETSEEEKAALVKIEEMDNALLSVRHRLRKGETITMP